MILATLGSAAIGWSGAGVAQESPEARPPSEADIEILGEIPGEENESLTVMDIFLEPGQVMRVYPDDPYWAVFEIIEGKLSISVTQGQVTLVQNGESRILGPDDGEVELSATDVIFAVGAEYSVTNLAERQGSAQDAQRNLAQPDADGTAKLKGTAKGCRSFCLGP